VFRKCPSERKPLSFLKHEYYVLSRLNHPGIPRPLGWEGDCLLLERVEASPLSEVDEQTVIALAEILDYIHGEGVIHRDINPNNIASGQRITLLDFDVSIYRGKTPALYAGTPGFIAPEQENGYPTFQSDYWSLGATLISTILGTTPPSPEPIDFLTERLLRKHPGERPANLQELGGKTFQDALIVGPYVLKPTPQQIIVKPGHMPYLRLSKETLYVSVETPISAKIKIKERSIIAEGPVYVLRETVNEPRMLEPDDVIIVGKPTAFSAVLRL
jgi:serine/threonine protein kinase